jgi:AcrR family transcriptional regulator
MARASPVTPGMTPAHHAGTFGGVDDLAAVREQLVEAAWNVLARTGFEGFKVSSVIRATGLSMRAFYRCFASKDDLFVELLLDETRRGAARIERMVAAEDDPAARVAAWVAAMMSAATQPGLTARTRLFTSLGERIEGRPEVWSAVRALLLPSLVAAIESGRQHGVHSSADPHADAILIQALCGATISDLVHGRSSDEPNDVIAHVQSMIARALRRDDRPVA